MLGTRDTKFNQTHMALSLMELILTRYVRNWKSVLKKQIHNCIIMKMMSPKKNRDVLKKNTGDLIYSESQVFPIHSCKINGVIQVL